MEITDSYKKNVHLQVFPEQQTIYENTANSRIQAGRQ